MSWSEWNPFLLDEKMSIADALATIPESPIKKIPFFVWLLENPTSPFRLAGATDPLEHDISHVVLGRGLLLQDEAFVIGFAIGNAPDSSTWDRFIFQFFGQLIYRKPFRFRARDKVAFDLGFDIGQSLSERGLFTHEPGALLEFPLSDVREAMGLSKAQLCKWYADEVAALPNGRASERLRRNINDQLRVRILK